MAIQLSNFKNESIQASSSVVNPRHRQKLFDCTIYRGLTKYIDILIKDPRVNPSTENNGAIRSAEHKHLKFKFSDLSGNTYLNEVCIRSYLLEGV